MSAETDNRTDREVLDDYVCTVAKPANDIREWMRKMASLRAEILRRMAHFDPSGGER